jgi:hypothetical protein
MASLPILAHCRQGMQGQDTMGKSLSTILNGQVDPFQEIRWQRLTK